MNAIDPTDDGVVLSLHVVPRASRTEVCGRHGDAIKVRLQAPPVDGKANAALVRWLAKRLDLPRNQVTITSGRTGRDKRVHVTGITAGCVTHRLGV